MQLIDEKTPWYTKMKLLRTKAGLSQEAISERLKVQQRNYWAWEKGLHTPNEQNQEKIAAVLGEDRAAIFGPIKTREPLEAFIEMLEPTEEAQNGSDV